MGGTGEDTRRRSRRERIEETVDRPQFLLSTQNDGSHESRVGANAVSRKRVASTFLARLDDVLGLASVLACRGRADDRHLDGGCGAGVRQVVLREVEQIGGVALWLVSLIPVVEKGKMWTHRRFLIAKTVNTNPLFPAGLEWAVLGRSGASVNANRRS